MELSSNCYGLFSEYSLWVETDNGSIPVTIKRPLVKLGEFNKPNDSEMTVIVDEEFGLTDNEKREVQLFVMDEITSGRVKFPVSLEYQTDDFTDVVSMELR